MLSTIELENEIKQYINSKLPEVDFKQINFCMGKDNSMEGTYVFAKEEKYHVLYAEKGKVREDKEFDEILNVLWNILNIILSDIALDYAMKNRIKGNDFRRVLFNKEIELFSIFGVELKKRKIEEIGNILKLYPYRD